MTSSAAPKANAEIPKVPLSSRCTPAAPQTRAGWGVGPGPEGAGPGLERPSANPGRGAFFSAWPRAEEGLWGSVGRTGVAATPAGTSPSSSKREGPAELDHFLISPGNPTPCPGLQVGLRPLRLVRPAPRSPHPGVFGPLPGTAQRSARPRPPSHPRRPPSPPQPGWRRLELSSVLSAQSHFVSNRYLWVLADPC